MVVRNEEHVVALNIAHHLAMGVDELWILDNGSVDRTLPLVKAIAERDPSVHWSTDEGPFLQSELVSGLAQEALNHGADWVIPIDGDEFWWNPAKSLRVALDRTDAGALVCQVQNFVQSQPVLHDHAASLMTMTYRADPVGLQQEARHRVEDREIAFVEMRYPPKLVLRPTPSLKIGNGNHTATGYAGQERTATDLVVLHAPIRARGRLRDRANTGRRHNAQDPGGSTGWQLRRVAAMNAEELTEEWAANSQRGGMLSVDGRAHELVRDDRLRDAVLPHIARIDRWLGPIRSRFSPERRRPGSAAHGLHTVG